MRLFKSLNSEDAVSLSIHKVARILASRFARKTESGRHMILAPISSILTGRIVILITVVIEIARLRLSLVTMRMRCDCHAFFRSFCSCWSLFILAALASQAARFLVVDKPEHSDAIVVLAGETNVRPARALELLRQGMAPRVFHGCSMRDVIYNQRWIDIAQSYVNSLPEASSHFDMSDHGFSTFAEADDASRCLQALGVHRVLIVTSDFHTRRASMIFRHRLPQYQFSVAAARGPGGFGNAWWRNREGAKSYFR